MGGKNATAWTPAADQRWKAPAPTSNFRQLYVNPTRRKHAHGVQPPQASISFRKGHDLNQMAAGIGRIVRLPDLQKAGFARGEDTRIACSG